jgi:hypothetical protein
MRRIGWGRRPLNWRGATAVIISVAVIVAASIAIRPLWAASIAVAMLLIGFIGMLRVTGTRPGRVAKH